jgi:hypothetical protein
MNSHNTPHIIIPSRSWASGVAWAFGICGLVAWGAWQFGVIDYFTRTQTVKEKQIEDRATIVDLAAKIEKLTTVSAVVATRVADIVVGLERLDRKAEQTGEEVRELGEQVGKLEGKVDVLSNPPSSFKRR